MSRTIEKTIYTFAELSDNAKERARDWWREGVTMDHDWSHMYDDFERVADILGIDFKTKSVPLMGGGTRQDPCIWWSGFWSQGDGACFEGTYSYAKGSRAKIREYAPQDAKLHRIADDLFVAQRRNFYRLDAMVRHSGRYYHEHSVSIDVEAMHDGDRNVPADAEKAVEDALRDFCRWMYRQLEAEYEYQMSDESVDEMLEANAYEFTEEGTVY